MLSYASWNDMLIINLDYRIQFSCYGSNVAVNDYLRASAGLFLLKSANFNKYLRGLS
jgi:hypothetical protein